MQVDQETGEVLPESTQGRILSALDTLRTFPEAMVKVALGIHDAMEAVRTYQKAGKITIVINVEPFKSKSNAPLIDEPVVMSCDVESKLPKADPPQQIFYADDDGNPSRTPAHRQRNLGGMDVKVTG